MDNRYMMRSLQLAELAKGNTAPNPMVGATLVFENRIIGAGYHHAHGEHHAEVDCLLSVDSKDRQLIPMSTMYVTLEPCAHFGLTPPCAVRLVEEKIKKVVIANGDPFSKVSGKGIELLLKAGIEVELGQKDREGLWLNRRFFCFHTLRRPYIVLKWAQTSDGYIAPADRSRTQISGPIAQLLVHKWRKEEAAIMVGTTTAINDNPSLTARLWSGRQPLRIVLDRDLKIQPAANLLDGSAATWVVNEQKEDVLPNIRYIRIGFDDRMIHNLLNKLYEANKLSVIVEGGAQLLNTFISAGLWDEARVFTSAGYLGSGIPAPVLTNATSSFSTKVGDDQLQVSVNRNSAYPYVAGMAL